ncbi:MAG: hypothetical protein KDH88_08710 [Chromatiales bacterium]|nr:hypothetical protein [Chromatiales bacterium]
MQFTGFHRPAVVAAALSLTCIPAVGHSAVLGAETITFDGLISGVPFFNYDSNDPDSITDVVFSTVDPFGFNTAGPGPDQLYINEPGLEGSTLINPDLRVDFLQGATGQIQFGFALIDEGSATFTAFNAANVPIGMQTIDGAYFALPGGGTSSFPENELVVPLAGTATYGLFDFDLSFSEGGRFIIDNFSFTPAGEDIIGGFQGALPDDPILPGEIVEGPNGVPEFNFDFPIDENGIGGIFPIFVDPVVAVGYDYDFTGGPNAASVIIPGALPNGDTEFDLLVPGFGTFTLTAGVSFDFTALDPLGIAEFSISGIDTSELLDPTDPTAFVTGLTYVAGGVSNLTMTPITTFVPSAGVPVPSILSLMVFGLFGLRGRLAAVTR